MAEQPDEETIQRLLNELQSAEAYRRKTAAESLAALKTSNDQIANALRSAAANDPNRFVRQTAREALIALGLEEPPPSDAPIQSASHKWLTQEFIIGFVGMFMMNCVIWVVATNVSGQYFPMLVLVINLAALIILAFVRPKIASGMLGALAVAFGVVVIAGLCVGVLCFGSYR